MAKVMKAKEKSGKKGGKPSNTNPKGINSKRYGSGK